MKCMFCEFKIEPNFREPENLEKCLSVRKKIMNRYKTNVCAKHQKTLRKQIKYAQFLGLIPYISYQGMKSVVKPA